MFQRYSSSSSQQQELPLVVCLFFGGQIKEFSVEQEKGGGDGIKRREKGGGDRIKRREKGGEDRPKKGDMERQGHMGDKKQTAYRQKETQKKIAEDSSIHPRMNICIRSCIHLNMCFI